jgi:8-oxo-dGTP pyrophosphatase MutT (NUDIX family)
MAANLQLWKPSVTVAALVERAGRFLLVEEHTAHGARYNQPAGHLEPGESLVEGMMREALEETAHQVKATALLGVYQYHSVADGVTYLRFAFIAEAVSHDRTRALDQGIIRAAWMTPDEIQQVRKQHRSPLVERCVHDYLAGNKYPLDVIARHSEALA